MKKKTTGVSIDLIIRNGEKVLLGRVSDKWKTLEGEWGLPGGDICFGETFQKSVEMNLERDLGITVKRFEIISVNKNFWLGNHYINNGILVEVEGKPQVRNKEDWKEWKWFDINNLPGKICLPTKLTLKSFLENKISVSE